MSSSAATALEAYVWTAIAGTNVKIPSPTSWVYYFPQGHAEHLNSSSDGSVSPPPPLATTTGQQLPSFFLCRILSVHFLADHSSDQVFAKLLLLPSRAPQVGPDDLYVENDASALTNGGGGEEENDIVSFAKTLTPSDANNGGGFSVPRFCADSIFPPLDFEADPPVQNLMIRDVLGNVFEFRHIYRGTPRRHLLTTGWSKFVNAKKLVAGDSVVFIRKRSTGELFIGVRRALRCNDGGTAGKWNCQALSGWTMEQSRGDEGGGEVLGFWRSVNGRAVVEAVEMAARGMPFEVVYFPWPGRADFVVSAEKVEGSLNMLWSAGTRVKMAVETEDSSRMTWFHGTVSAASLPENGPWSCSPWRMLQITWDEPEVLQNVTRVSPWQVEYVVQTQSLHSAFPSLEKIKDLQNPELLPDAEEEFYSPMTDICKTIMGPLNLLSQNQSSPAGMQGARQDQLCVSSLPDFRSDSSIHKVDSESSNNNNVKSNLTTVSIGLNNRSSNSENFSPDSQSSVHYYGTELAEKLCGDTLAKLPVNSFQLFGKIIQTGELVQDGFDYLGCTGEESKRVYKDNASNNCRRSPEASWQA